MSLSDDYQEEVRRRQAAQTANAAERDRERQEAEGRVGIAIATAGRVEAEVIKPFLRAADSTQGRVAGCRHDPSIHLHYNYSLIPDDYVNPRRRGWRRAPERAIWMWIMIADLNASRAAFSGNRSIDTWDTAILAIFSHGAWSYELTKQMYDERPKVVFSIGRRPHGSRLPDGLFGSPLDHGDAVFEHVKRTVVSFMAEHGIVPR